MSGEEERSDEAEAAQGEPLLEPGRTCWRVEQADRVAFLVDGENYYGALAAALERAQRRVFLIGWDFHSRVALRRESKAQALPEELAPLLDALARRRRKLQIFVLEWDFAMLYWSERELLRAYRFARRTHRRVRFRFDAEHPIGASHHQKLVVIDDALAFAGGLDLTSSRWDTRAHAKGELRRVDPDGRRYAPFHDVQIAVDGAAAGALGWLARERWRRATGRRLGDVRGDHDPWPLDLEPHMRDVGVGIARTDSAGEGQTTVREVELLYRECIVRARRWIYVENQYLTSTELAESFAARLRESGGPEVVIVLPERCSGWLEDSTMGVLRDRFVRILREADHEDRLRILYPRLSAEGGEVLNVHAKLMVVDDRVVRIGSANLSNRSMGFDSECDLAIEARRPEQARAIARFRNELLAEHLGTSPERVEERLAREASLVRLIENLGGGERSLEPLEVSSGEWTAELAERVRVFDPEQPLGLRELLPMLGAASEEHRDAPRRAPLLALLAFCAAALAAWRFTPLASLVEVGALASVGEAIRSHALGAPLSALLVGAATLAFVPVTALVVACGLVYPPMLAFGVALAGSTLGAAAGYALGRGLWRDTVHRLAGARFQRVSRTLGRRGILATATVRLLPIAPFGLVNLVAGASHVRLRDFVCGTMLAMAPGIATLVFASDRVVHALRSPDATSVLTAVATVAGAAGVLFVLRRVDQRGGAGDGS